MPPLKTHKSAPKRTICEVHRDIYDELVKLDGSEKAIKLLEEAFGMGKALVKKLIQYKYDYLANCNQNKDYLETHYKRLERELAQSNLKP